MSAATLQQPTRPAGQPRAEKPRIDWVDYAKGICIILVVMMHSTLGVEKALGATGYLHAFIEWAKPFRMPDFFLISGLFLSLRINASWRSYLDSKVLHFAYFYVLWMTIQFAFKGPGQIAELGLGGVLAAYLTAFVQPFGTLWFIYLLAIFFVVTKLVKELPPLLVFAGAAALEALPLHTGSLIVDEFASRYVYFFAGYWLANAVFRAADSASRLHVLAVAALLLVWGSVHTLFVLSGSSELPGIGLALGFAGCAAVIAAATLLARSGYAEWLRYLGANSIVVYLAFFLFMAAARSLGLKIMPGIDVDVLAAVTTLAACAGPILLYWAVRTSPLKLLFQRPQWAKVPAAGPSLGNTSHAGMARLRQLQGR